MNNKLLMGAAILTGAMTVALSASVVKAQDETDVQPFIQQMSERFGLNQDEVEEFVEEKRVERRTEMHVRHEEQLHQVVENGVLTQEQADTLQENHREMWQEREQEREEHRAEMDTWFESQGIDHEQLMDYMGGGFGHNGGFGNRRMMHRN